MCCVSEDDLKDDVRIPMLESFQFICGMWWLVVKMLLSEIERDVNIVVADKLKSQQLTASDWLMALQATQSLLWRLQRRRRSHT